MFFLVIGCLKFCSNSVSICLQVHVLYFRGQIRCSRATTIRPYEYEDCLYTGPKAKSLDVRSYAQALLPSSLFIPHTDCVDS